MIEAVGHEYMEEFFGSCESILAENGLLVLQVKQIFLNNIFTGFILLINEDYHWSYQFRHQDNSVNLGFVFNIIIVYIHTGWKV